MENYVGIDAIHFDIPKIHLPISDLAIARGIDPMKLEKGLGLKKMTLPDVHQDAVVFAANALQKLWDAENLSPEDIDRLYVGTESAVDGSKPIASYLLQFLAEQYGESRCLHIDIVDLTFACIGGVDAMLNSLDYIRLNPDKKAIVICTDIAKYDLASTGEYTQGAGAVALLLSADPSIMTINKEVGVSAAGVFDFFKPRRIIKKSDIQTTADLPAFYLEEEVEIFKESPVFDGQYSNTCYTNRVVDAYHALKKKKNIKEQAYYNQWSKIIMHLPYAYQARRMFVSLYIQDNSSIRLELQDAEDEKSFIKIISKSEDYKSFVQARIAGSEMASSDIGNMYTGSIFMALISALHDSVEKSEDLERHCIGFLAYGSGSKSKAFEGILVDGYEQKIKQLQLNQVLNQSTPIDFATYELLHTKAQKTSVLSPKNEYVFKGIVEDNPLQYGARMYSRV